MIGAVRNRPIFGTCSQVISTKLNNSSVFATLKDFPKMSWNPFNKLMAQKKSTSKAFEDNEFDVRVQQVVLIEQVMKKLHKDTKKSVESSSALSKVEQRMMFELLNSAKSIKDAEMLTESAEKLTNVSCQTEDSQSQRDVIIRCIVCLV